MEVTEPEDEPVRLDTARAAEPGPDQVPAGAAAVRPRGPVASFAVHAGRQVRELKEMVRTFHREGLEVILDVVYNHTSEGNEHGPTLSFRGLDNVIYYLLDKEGHNWTYLPYGPFPGFAEYCDFIEQAALRDDPLVHAIVERHSGRAACW